MRHFSILCLLISTLYLAACGEANKNDFAPTDNVLRRGSEGADDEKLRALRAAGHPASIEEAQAADVGLLIRLENQLQWPEGARGVKTAVHLNARLCGEKSDPKHSKKGEDKVEMTHCHELEGTVNQGDHEYFYLTAGEAFMVIKDCDRGYRATLQYKVTCQTTANWYSGGTVELNERLDSGKQTAEVQVVEARPLSYRDSVQSHFSIK